MYVLRNCIVDLRHAYQLIVQGRPLLLQPLTGAVNDPVVQFTRSTANGDVTLRVDSDDLEGPACLAITLSKVRAYRYIADQYCQMWHLAAPLGLTQIPRSSWVRQLRRDAAPGFFGNWHLVHYMLYVPGAGCYEVVAGSWRVEIAYDADPGR